MARWILILLLLCNAIYFGWEFFLQQPQPVQEPPQLARGDGGDGERLVLVREADLSPRPQEPPPGVPAPEAAPEPEPLPPEERVCDMIGPFSEEVSARQIQNRLAARDIGVSLYQLTVPGEPDYWVHLGPMTSRKEAVATLRELQAEGIDSFLITEGELKNGISLGFFTRQELATRVQAQRLKQGYDAKIREVPRNHNEIWAVFEPGEFSEFSLRVWEEIQAGHTDLELRKNYCDAIASAVNLD